MPPSAPAAPSAPKASLATATSRPRFWGRGAEITELTRIPRTTGTTGTRGGSRRITRRLPAGFLVLALGLGLGPSACARRGGETAAPEAPKAPTTWIDGPLIGPEVEPPLPVNEGSAAARMVRLDRLLDLLDAARFTGDPQAREALWIGLGGVAKGRGPEATREASARLLDAALALEDHPDLAPEEREWVASAILLLTTDLHRPATADDLAIQSAAYRELVARGHPRIADNARWRRFDHVRGCLEGAVSATPQRRPEIAVHSLYSVEESIEAHLDESRSIHARPPLPAPSELWALLEGEVRALQTIPRWAPVLAARAEAEATLRELALSALPAPRDPTWELAIHPAGTGREESLAPIIRVDGERVIVDEGRPQARGEPLSASSAARAIEAALSRDGRGIVLAVAPPLLPSPALRELLQALLRARVSTVEFAIREPRIAEDTGDVILALPLELLRADDQGPAALGLRDARLQIHLDGRGPRLAVEGRWLSAQPADARELTRLLDRLDRAFPRERRIVITLGDDVLLQQLLDLLVALLGGPERRYEVVAWAVDRDPAATVVASPVDAEDRRLERRAARFTTEASATLELPFPLPQGDNARLEALARQLSRCLPEYEARLPAAGLRLEVAFEAGKMNDLQVRGEPRGSTRSAALRACIAEETRGFRLREHRDALKISVILRP